MAVKIQRRGEDARIEQILRDPKRYFAEARARTRAAVQAEVARERGPGRTV